MRAVALLAWAVASLAASPSGAEPCTAANNVLTLDTHNLQPAEKVAAVKRLCADGSVVMVPSTDSFVISSVCDFSKQILKQPGVFGPVVYCAVKH
jgi:hypothetical protein